MFSQFLSSTARQSTVAPEESSYCGIEVNHHHIFYLVDVNVLQWVPVQERRIRVWIEEEVEYSDVVGSHGLVDILVPDQELKDVQLLRLVGSVESPEVFLHPLVDLEPGYHDGYILRPLQQKQVWNLERSLSKLENLEAKRRKKLMTPLAMIPKMVSIKIRFSSGSTGRK